MAQIKYSYCKDENDELVYIKSLSNETRHDRRLYCLSCGQEMVANLGTKKEWYFSHKVDCACDGESYLHKLAKRRIKEKFDSSDSFPIKFRRDIPCKDKEKCLHYSSSDCVFKGYYIPCDLKFWDEKTVYDTCEEEVAVGDFRPDLLLTHSTKPKRHPTFIEIYNTHKSSEAKTSSKYRIIETIKIESEDVIDRIIKNGFVEGKNCTTYNFKPKLPVIKKEDVPIERFVLFHNGGAIVHSWASCDVLCKSLNQKIEKNSIIELNIRERDLASDSELPYHSLSSLEKGLTYLVKKGWEIRNCVLCKYYTYKFFHFDYICTQYKILGLLNSKPKQTTASNCPRYILKQELLAYPISELEKDVFELQKE